MSEALHTKYRPLEWDEFVGQLGTIKSLRSTIEKKRSQTFLFSGPGGCGKTSLARVAAYHLHCEGRDLLEIDAATYSGVDKMREVMQLIAYSPMGGEGKGRGVLIDECHRLSGAAWDSILKSTEEPKPGVFWFLCTTNLSKVPVTIKTRFAQFPVKLYSDAELTKVCNIVIKLEKMKVADGVVQVVVAEARGSARQALVYLAQACDAANQREARDLLHAAQETDATLELCRFITAGKGSWVKAMSIFERLESDNPEGVRIMVCNYLGAVLKGAKSDNSATAALMKLEHWSRPYEQAEGTTPLLVSIGRSLFEGE